MSKENTTPSIIESKHERKTRLVRERYIINSLNPEWVERKNKNKREYRAKKRLDPEWVENRRIKYMA